MSFGATMESTRRRTSRPKQSKPSLHAAIYQRRDFPHLIVHSELGMGTMCQQIH